MKKCLISILSIVLFISCNEMQEGEIAYTINEQDLIPEGITYSEKSDYFFVSSILKTKIVQINAVTCKSEDFIPSTRFNRRFLGMIVDQKRNHLWACGNMKVDGKTYSSVFKFDIDLGKLIKEYNFPDTMQQLLNDLVIDRLGNAYFTDSNNQHIYKINAISDSIELFYEGNEIEYPNGITISPNEKYLYIASYEKGIRVLNIKSREIVNEVNNTIDSKDLDGLKMYQNSLIGIQNYLDDIHNTKIVRYYLDHTQTQITRAKIIDQDNPHFDVPTTHVIVSNNLYCLATSQLNNVDWEQYTIADPSKLHEVIILKYELN
ncbi:MAG: hypothetical protein C0597_03125 [Marinilabiliales bacterium]|nr:MAG: hypothetical protein C0597_03125 [Marinilabiliales bacterium]